MVGCLGFSCGRVREDLYMGCVGGCSIKREESGLVHQVTEHLEAEGEMFNTVDMLPLEGYFKTPVESTRENAEQSQQARLINFH